MDKHIYTVDELVNNDSFRRWVFGTANEPEVTWWDQWAARRSENRRLARKAQQRLAGFSFHPTVRSSTNTNWNWLRDEITRASASTKKESLRYHTVPRFRIQKLLSYYTAAAVLVIAFTAGLVGFVYNWENIAAPEAQVVATEVTTKFSERKTVRLSDGSTIILNANSSIDIDSNPDQPLNVRVRLEGEALFRVAERSHPEAVFTVQTRDGIVRVLGTEFVVTDRDRETHVVLTEGSVAIQIGPEADTQAAMHTIQPGQMASFQNNSDAVRVESVNAAVYTSWATPTLVFDSTPLRQIIQRLEHTFGAEVTVRDSSLYDRRLSGTIKNSSLSVTAEAVARSLLIGCEVQGLEVWFGPNQSQITNN